MLIPLFPLFIQLSFSPSEQTRNLYEAIHQGDEYAFSEFFNQHYASIYRYVSRYGVRHEVAQDIVQQSFIYFWDHRASIKPDKSLKAYLYATAHSRVLNSLRDSKEFAASDKDYLFERPTQDAKAVTSNELTSDSAEFQSSLDKSAEKRKADQTKAIIEQAIQSLAPKRQQVFRLCYLEHFTYDETAQIMNLSIKTVEHHMGLALAELRKKLENIR